jgi:hypothetical protein
MKPVRCSAGNNLLVRGHLALSSNKLGPFQQKGTLTHSRISAFLVQRSAYKAYQLPSVSYC